MADAIDAPLLLPAKDITAPADPQACRAGGVSHPPSSPHTLSYHSTSPQCPPPLRSGCRSRGSPSPQTAAAVGHSCCDGASS
eukprot:688617-Pleurochrysis_carterae.AAC.1